MQKVLVCFLCILALTNMSFAQSCTVHGYVKDAVTKETLIGAVVCDKQFSLGTTTNQFGFFSLKIDVCNIDSLLVNYVGHISQTIAVNDNLNHPVVILLQPDEQITEVVITDSQRINETNEMSTLNVPVGELKKMPSMFGEADILRVFQLMPGVQGGKEGTSGINVRGGSPDQNLFLLDDVPLYYVNHIGGFLSTFDASAVKSAELYKGAFPARYGGRLSSVVDIRMKDGDMNKRHGEYALGTLAMKLSLQGPIKKDTSSYFISVRRCNLDLFTRLAALMDSQGQVQAGYTFFDVYGKVNRILNSKQRLFISTYAGRDRIFVNSTNKASNADETSIKFRSNIQWGNQMFAARLNHIFSPSTFGNTTLAFTRYSYNNHVEARQAEYGSNKYGNESRVAFTSSVADIVLKQDIHYQYNEIHSIQFGLNSTVHFFNQGKIEYTNPFSEETNSTGTEDNSLVGLENVLYAEDNIKIGKKTGFVLGLHFSNYNIRQKSFFSLQPRILARRSVGKNSAFKASFVTMRQFIHLLSSNGAGLPSDLWIPATDLLPPSNCIQAALGYSVSFAEDKNWEFNTELYVKKFDNLVEYKEGISIFSSDQNINGKVANGGVGNAYGIEFQLQKLHGRTTGWCAYTYSKNERQFATINQGNWFPYRYDRPHAATVVINHEVNENIFLSATWSFNSGNPVTLAQQQYGAFNYFNYQAYPNSTEPTFSSFPAGHIYNGRNAYRMPDFHKLDIAINFTKKKPTGSRTWNISIYNLYNRQNPFFLFYRQTDEQIKLYQLSIFPIIPSFSYSRVF